MSEISINEGSVSAAIAACSQFFGVLALLTGRMRTDDTDREPPLEPFCCARLGDPNGPLRRGLHQVGLSKKAHFMYDPF